jgi:hypothetical protein
MASGSPRQASIGPCKCGMEAVDRPCSLTEVIPTQSTVWPGPLMASGSPRLAPIRPCRYGCGSKDRVWEQEEWGAERKVLQTLTPYASANSGWTSDVHWFLADWIPRKAFFRCQCEGVSGFVQAILQWMEETHLVTPTSLLMYS